MRKLSFLALAVAGMLFAACSSDKDAAEGTQVPGEIVPEGYMALNIKLPTQPLMRAANDNFDDGLVEEYKVSDCALLLFQSATDEASATLINAQAILLPFDETVDDADNDNITTSYLATAKVKGFTTGNKLYALAVLNYKNLMSIEASGMPKIAGITLTTTSTIADVRALTTNADLTSRSGAKDYFFMTNAVLSKAQGGVVGTAPAVADIFQLAEMDPSKIKETEAAAKEDPAGDIIVERAVAKATLAVTATKVNGLGIAKTEWAIDNMEPISYVAHNPGDLSYIGYKSGGNDNYRFVGNLTTKGATSLGSTNDAYRTYWGIDPQYDTDATSMVAATSFVQTGAAYPLYCYENTFDVQRQSFKNTTRAIIKVTLVDTDDFWTVNGNDTRYKTVGDATSYVVDNIVNKTEVLNAFKAGLNAGKSWTVNASSFDITYERDGITGQYKVKTLALSPAVLAEIDPTKTFKSTFDTDIAPVLDAAITSANQEVVVRDYQGGVMYFEARFKHFAGEGATDLAPWNTKAAWETPAPAGGSTTAAYPGYNAQFYLGRYGMVRNNWYDVEVTAFNNFGYPADPSGQVNNPDFDDPNTPDDDIQEYISAKIHVLSWAKRTQSWSF